MLGKHAFECLPEFILSLFGSDVSTDYSQLFCGFHDFGDFFLEFFVRNRFVEGFEVGLCAMNANSSNGIFTSLKDGDKVAFIEQGDQIVVVNASLEALMRVQQAFSGVAQEQELRSEEDVVQMINNNRQEIGFN